MRVIVAGAGLAGLTAAHELVRKGAEVVIVEARQRAGGRVWTVRDGFLDHQYAELGGEFIDDDQPQIRRLSHRFGLTLVPVLRGGFTQRFQPDGEFPRLHRTAGWDLLAEAVEPLVKDYRARGGDSDTTAVRDMAGYSLRDWLRHVDAGADVHAAANALRGLFLADPEELSVLQLVEQLADGGSPAHTKMSRIAGGSDRLVDALIARTDAPLLYAHVVRRITQAEAGVTVAVEDGHGRLTEITSDAVVAALPASTLRRVEIDPPLADTQRRAIERVKYGCATKVVLQRAVAGLRTRKAKAFATDDEVGAFWDSTEGQPTGSHSMLTFLGGGSASASLRNRAQRGPRALLSPVCWLGDRVRDDGSDDVRVASVSWEHEDYSGGGYAFLDPAFDPAWRPLLSRRAGRIVFAGEHSSDDWQGYMEGAVESGIQAARKLLARPA